MKTSDKFRMGKMRSVRLLWLSALLLVGVSCVKNSVVRFGVCADVHKDIRHDADQRLQVFIDEMNEADVDFIIELGDFMQPQAYNASFLDIWSSFDREGFHFIVLDGNDVKDPPQEGYARYMGKEQLAWLRRDLAGTGSRVIIFSHQSIEDPGGVENAAGVRLILEEANRQSGKKKVIACFSGHQHIDYATEINGIGFLIQSHCPEKECNTVLTISS